MANSTVMTTVSYFKKYLKECLKTSKVVESNYEDNVLINLAHDWLGEHYSSKTEKFNYHVYLVWFAIRELLQTNFKRDPTSTDTIATALKYPDEFKKCHNVDSNVNYDELKKHNINIEFNPDDSIKKCIHCGYDDCCSCITDAYKIGTIARVLHKDYIANKYTGDFSLPEGKEYNGILDGDVIIDTTVHQKSTYDMLCDLKDYLQRCYESDDLLPYNGSPQFVDLTDIVISSIRCITGKYEIWKGKVHMKECAYTIWFAVIAWLLKGERENTVETVNEIFENAFYDFKTEREKFKDASKCIRSSVQNKYKNYWAYDKPDSHRYICNIHYCMMELERCIAKYNNTIKPDDAINPPFDLDLTIKIEQKPVYNGVSINDIEKLAVYKDKLIEIINNMVGIGTAAKGMVDVFVAGQFDYDTFNNAVDILDVIRDEAKGCAPQFRIVF